MVIVRSVSEAYSEITDWAEEVCQLGNTQGRVLASPADQTIRWPMQCEQNLDIGELNSEDELLSASGANEDDDFGKVASRHKVDGRSWRWQTEWTEYTGI